MSIYKGTQLISGINSALLTQKMDADATNATSTTVNTLISKADSTAKQTIDGWGIPNYSAGISISSGYVATSNGFVTIRRGTGSAYVYLYVNGIQVDSNESNTSNEGGTLSAFVQKGATVTWTTTNITGTPTFYPLIGG